MKQFVRHLFPIMGTGLLVAALVLLNGRVVIAGEPGDDSHHHGPVPVRDVDNPANEPFESFVCVSSGKTFAVCPAGGDTFTIPLTTNSGKTAKRYVIEYVSGICLTAPGEGITQVFLAIPSGGFPHFFVPVNVTFNSSLENDYTFAQQTRLYVTPGQTVQIGTGRIGALLADYACTLQFNGYFVTK